MRNQRNFFKFYGKIISIRSDKNDGKSAYITLRVVNGTTSSFLEIRCLKEIIPPHRTHSYVEIEGYVSGNCIKINDKYIYNHRLNGVKITVSKSLIEEEFGVEGFYREPKNSYWFLTGIIKDVLLDEKNDFQRYITEITLPDQSSSQVVISWRCNSANPCFKIDDAVCAVCTPAVSDKRNRNQQLYLNFNVFDMRSFEL